LGCPRQQQELAAVLSGGLPAAHTAAQVYHNLEWFTPIINNWNRLAALAVCRQLGWSAVRRGVPGQGRRLARRPAPMQRSSAAHPKPLLHARSAHGGNDPDTPGPGMQPPELSCGLRAARSCWPRRTIWADLGSDLPQGRLIDDAGTPYGTPSSPVVYLGPQCPWWADRLANCSNTWDYDVSEGAVRQAACLSRLQHSFACYNRNGPCLPGGAHV
jgi:hypothetical protein